MIPRILLLWLLLTGALPAAEVLRVISLNPIASDLARTVGGSAVEVTDLMRPGQDPHAFAPSPSDLRKSEDARLILAMGKGLETYLEDLRTMLRQDQTLVEIGRRIPSLRLDGDMALFSCCPSHAHGVADPHWWHSPRNMKRAARLVADAFAAAAPKDADGFRARAREYARRLDVLDQWARRELDRIPPTSRRLTTAHAAFNYFCEDYRFKPVPILGLSTLDQPRPGQLQVVLDTIRRERIVAVFPEAAANPAPLEAVVAEAGIRLGGALLAGSPLPEEPTFEAMFRHNVRTLVEALAPARGEDAP